MLQKVHRLKHQVHGSFFTLKAKLGHWEFLGPNGCLELCLVPEMGLRTSDGWLNQFESAIVLQ